MAAVLGPELDLFLRGIGQELKGKTQLEEPHVDKRTIIRAVREQNNVIITLQERILRMKEIEEGMQKTLDLLQEKVTYFETYTKKVDKIEEILSVKIPLVDKMNEVIQDHDTAIDCISFKVKEQTNLLSTFKSETQSTILQTKNRIENICVAIDEMPQTIMISTRQVKHLIYDEIEGQDNNASYNSNEELLEDIITQQEQRTFVQDKSINRLENKIGENVASQNKLNMKAEENTNDLIVWKEQQKDVDLVTIRENQNSMKKVLDNQEVVLSIKISKEEVDDKLQSQFSQLVDHLQIALTAVESDEADFKSVTDSLSNLCESLREKKADKSEIVSLRKQFIDNQVNGDGEGSYGIPLGGCTLDNEEIMRILSRYPTTTKVENMIGIKAQQQDIIVPRFERMDSTIQNMQKFLEKILSVVTNNDVTSSQKEMMEECYQMSLPSLTLITPQETSNGDKNSDCRTLKDIKGITGPAIIYEEKLLSIDEKDMITVQRQRSASSEHDNVISRKVPHQSQEKGSQGFPSSNIINGSLGDFCSSEEIVEHANQLSMPASLSETFLSRSMRPTTAPLNEIKKKPKVKKRHSLPAIFTSISKSVRPRLRDRVAESRVNEDVGSFQFISSGSKHQDVDSQPLDQMCNANIPFSKIHYIGKNVNTKLKRSSKKDSIIMRTSIE